MITLSGGAVQEMRLDNLSEYGDDAVQGKLRSRINDPSQFEDLMVELSLAAWHQGKGHKVTPFEKEGWPDLRLDIEGFNRATFLECKRLAVYSPQRIAKHIQKANKQLKAVGIAAYGVVVLDITACIGSGLAPLTDDIPDGVTQIIDGVRAAVAGPKNRSVGRVLLMWDESGVLGVPPERTLIFLRRRLASVDHPPTNGTTEVPSGLPLFEGSTVVFTLHWDDSAAGITTLQVSDLMNQCFAWFNFTTDELIDAFNRRDKWQLISVASDAEFVLFARRTVLNDKSAYTLCLGNRAADALNLQFAIQVPSMI